MTYEEICNYIYEIPKFTKKNSLEHTKEMLQRLSIREHQFEIIHVAGSNGKGSVCAFINQVLVEHGCEVGLFTSPHLVCMEERFVINGEKCSQEEFVESFEAVQKVVEQMEAEGLPHPAFFEYLFAMGMYLFQKRKVHYLILETGLGGRLDATNVFEEPLLTIITSISLEHTQILGDSIEAIAGEKAGIIVPGVPVIYDGNNPEAAKVIRKQAEALGSPYYEVKKENTEILRNTSAGIDFCMENEYYGNTAFSIPFIAGYQVMNAALALKTAEVIKDVVNLPKDAVLRGLRETRWQGRMETVLPGVIVDGAHNEDGVEKFVETAEHFQKDYPLTLLFSAVDDKDYTDMIRTVAGRIRFQHVIVTQVGGYRKVPAEQLADIFRKEGCLCAESCEDVEMAFRRALEYRGKEGMLFCVGSLYLVGEIKAIIQKMTEH